MSYESSRVMAAIKSLKSCIEDGSWEDTKKRCLEPQLPEDRGWLVESQEREEGLRKLQTLVTYRDSADLRMYFEAIVKIFPSYKYKVIHEVSGKIADEGAPRFKSSWFQFVVKIIGEEGEEAPCCIIKVDAPGSRTPTSDIDTSIATSFKGDRERLLKYVVNPRIKDANIDYEGKITNAVIDWFYKLSEANFGATSGMHRDSNAYVDLAAKEIDRYEYPKFKDGDSDGTFEERNPLFGTDVVHDRLFKRDEFVKIFAPYKEQKHLLEIAASLFSLRMALEPRLGEYKEAKESKERKESKETAEVITWETFKEQVLKNIDDVSSRFDVESSIGAAYSKNSKGDLEKIFKEVEKIFKDYQGEIAREKHSIKTEHDKNSKLKGTNKEKDLEIFALNRLYVKYLESMSDYHGQIQKRQKENQELSKLIKEKGEAIQVAMAELKLYREQGGIFEKLIPAKEQSCAKLDEERKKYIEEFKVNIFEIARLQIEKLKTRYRAHTFANEAYVCRSAVYHVVYGIQKKENIKMTDQTLLSSTLQQIGFRLLHAQELIEQGRSPGEVWYRTSKYGYRVYHLFFPDSETEVRDEQVKLSIDKWGPNKWKILKQLKSSDWNDYLFRFFSSEELALVNLDKRICLKLKKPVHLSEIEKHAQTMEILERSKPIVDQWRPLYISLASKTIAVAYFSRFIRKQALWGTISPLKPIVVPTTSPVPAKKEVLASSRAEKKDGREEGQTLSKEEGGIFNARNMHFKAKAKGNFKGSGSLLKADYSGSTVEGDADFSLTHSPKNPP